MTPKRGQRRKAVRDFSNVMENTEKIKIYVPEQIDQTLKKDAERFEIFNKKGDDINLNGFLTRLILGYADEYQEEINQKTDAIRRCVKDTFYQYRDQEVELLTRKLMVIVFDTEKKLFAGQKDHPISFKPTKETDHIVTKIGNLLEGGEKKSSYFRRLFAAYCSKPVYEREQIIFRENYNFLLEACKRKTTISFTMTTKPTMIHTVRPYTMTRGLDEQFNYLLGQEQFSIKNGLPGALSYRLCRIRFPYPSHEHVLQDDKITEHLKLMMKYDPRYPINEDTEACIQLTKLGQNSFRKIYMGRPIPDRKEIDEQNGTTKYYFRCSQEQLYQYFRRFNPGEAKILYPEQLKQRIISFHKRHLDE